MSCGRTACSLILLAATSCIRQPGVEGRVVDVQAGLGIAKNLEVGMTVQEMRNHGVDLTIHGGESGVTAAMHRDGSRYVLVPAFGATAPIESNDQLATICFHVHPYDSDSTAHGLVVTNPFRGTINGKLSFENGTVTREAVESYLGRAESVVTNLLDGRKLAEAGKPFLHHVGDGAESLYYRHKGITFDLRTNVVASFWIYRAEPVGPNEKRN